jgi:hypothetical protein
MITYQKAFVREPLQIVADGDLGNSKEPAQLSHPHASTGTN